MNYTDHPCFNLYYEDRHHVQKEKHFISYDKMFKFVCKNSGHKTVWEITATPKHVYYEVYNGEVEDGYADIDRDYMTQHYFYAIDAGKNGEYPIPGEGNVVKVYRYTETFNGEEVQ